MLGLYSGHRKLVHTTHEYYQESEIINDLVTTNPYATWKMASIPVDRFGLTRLELKVLMSKRKEEAVKALETTSLECIAQHLETNLKGGLSGSQQDLESRRAFYGTNQLPQNPPKSFLALCFDAVQDPTQIILTCAAILSIVLGVTVEERKVKLSISDVIFL